MLINNIKEIKNQNGTTLLLALLIMFALTLSGFIISLVVLGQIRAARNTEFSIQAYYAADAGIEKSLHKIKIDRMNHLMDLTTALSDINAYYSSSFSSNLAEYEVDAVSGEYKIQIPDSLRKLLPDQSVQYNFYDPENPTNSMDLDMVLPVWSDTCNGNSSIELSFYNLKNVLDPTLPQSDNVQKVIYDCGGLGIPPESPICIASLGNPQPALSSIPNPDESYIVRAKIIRRNLGHTDDCVVYIGLAGFNDSGNILNEPNMITLESIGVKNDNQIKIQAVLPWLLNVSGLADFVLFSEEPIIK